MKRRTEIEEAIFAEVERWPDAKVEIEQGKGHPKARLEFAGLIMRRAFPGTPGDRRSVVKTLADIRRTLRQMGAKRDGEATEAEDEAVAEKVYRKPNNGREARPDPVAREPVRPKPTVAEQMAAVGFEPSAEPPPWEPEPGVEGEAEVIPPEIEFELFGIALYAGMPARERERRVAAIAGQVTDGVYFGLPEDIYHAVQRLSTSGITKICISPADFWAESWLNPKPKVLSEEQEARQQAARFLGRAYHCARLEPARFEDRYYRKPAKADLAGIEGVLWNGTQVGEMLGSYGETKKRGSENVLEQCRRLEDCGYPHPIWPLVEAEAEKAANGRLGLSGADWDDITTDMDRLRRVEEVAALLSAGEAEVSIFWTDRYNIPMKCRIDWLADAHWAEFKTFANPNGKTLRRAIADALQYNRYHIQPVVNRDGVEAIRIAGLQIVGEASDEQRRLIASIQMRPAELEFWHIFQQKGGVPNVLARRFPFFSVPLNTTIQHAGASEEGIARVEEATRTMTGLHIRACQDIDGAKREFMLYSQVYPPGVPWTPIHPLGDWEDSDFNRYWLEGRDD